MTKLSESNLRTLPSFLHPEIKVKRKTRQLLTEEKRKTILRKLGKPSDFRTHSQSLLYVLNLIQEHLNEATILLSSENTTLNWKGR